MLTLDSSQQVLSVYIWDHGKSVAPPSSLSSLSSLDAFVFEKSSQLRHPTLIYNVIPGDFTLDGKLDILVMSANSATTLNMALYMGNHDGTFRMCMICLSQSASEVF